MTIFYKCQNLLDVAVIDLSFSSCYNLISDYQSTYPAEHYIGKISSLIFVSALILNYLYLLDIANKKPWLLGMGNSLMIVENLSLKVVQKSVRVRSLNIIFRIKLMVFMACIVAL